MPQLTQLQRFISALFVLLGKRSYIVIYRNSVSALTDRRSLDRYCLGVAGCGAGVAKMAVQVLAVTESTETDFGRKTFCDFVYEPITHAPSIKMSVEKRAKRLLNWSL